MASTVFLLNLLLVCFLSWSEFSFSVSCLLSALTCLSFSCVLSAYAFTDKILAYLNCQKPFYNKYNNNNDNIITVINIVIIIVTTIIIIIIIIREMCSAYCKKRTQEIIVNMHVFVRNASWSGRCFMFYIVEDI